MSDELPEELRTKLMKKLMAEAARRARATSEQQEDPEKVVRSRLADERAEELHDKVRALYPSFYEPIVRALYDLLKRGAIEEVDGLLVLSIVRRLGLRVTPDLKLRFVKHGKEVDFKDYVE
ncbi:MAG: hypothetical protein ABWK00_02100 [Desulfurococcaceae archaeon]